MKGGSTCVLCKKGYLKRKVQDEIFNYKGKKITISNYITFECDNCKEEFVSQESLKASRKVLKDHQRKVDGLLTSEEIKRIREKFDYTQEKFAKVLKVADKTFARYENGSVTQNQAMDNLLRILDSYPTVISLLTPEVYKNTPRAEFEYSSTMGKKKYMVEQKEINRKAYTYKCEQIVKAS